MQQVVYSVLSYVADNGLPGQHHFYIRFQTTASGVILPDRVLARYPEQITIVLQHEFYDLIVNRTAFHVALVFDGVRERITVPFEALTEFSDPFANFSMQFDMSELGSSDDDMDDEESEAIMRSMTQDLTFHLSDELSRSIRSGSGANEKKSDEGEIIYIADYLDKNKV